VRSPGWKHGVTSSGAARDGSGPSAESGRIEGVAASAGPAGGRRMS